MTSLPRLRTARYTNDSLRWGNTCQVEDHLVDGRPRRLLVHRKGSTRAFPPHHPLIPVDYQFVGQPVLIGGSMGSCSYVLTGTEKVCCVCLCKMQLTVLEKNCDEPTVS